MAKLYISYTERESGGDTAEGEDDSDPYRMREDGHIEVTFQSLHVSPPSDRMFYHSIDVADDFLKKDYLYLAVVRYYDGGTFGRTYGYWEAIGAYEKYDEADDALKWVLSPDGRHPKKGYKSWEGYFAGVTGQEIHELTVRKS